MLRPVISISAGCAKCGAPVTRHSGIQSILVEHYKTYVDSYDRHGHPRFKTGWRWKYELATYDYYPCLVCGWVVTHPTSANIIGSEFYARTELHEG